MTGERKRRGLMMMIDRWFALVKLYMSSLKLREGLLGDFGALLSLICSENDCREGHSATSPSR